jgi:hypothetical protein
MKARYRNKLKKIIVEVFNGERWLYVKTLTDPLVEFKAECLAKVSQNSPKNSPNINQTFAQDKLTDTLEKDIIRKPTEEELKKLWEITKEE